VPRGISGIELLERHARRLESVAALGDEGSNICAEAIGKRAKATYAAGRSPDWKRWAPRKADGGRALANAPEHVAFEARSDGIYQSAPDHYRFHRTGTKHMVKRNVYAEGRPLPAAWAKAADQALQREYAKRMR
jgi:hypothetical protein